MLVLGIETSNTTLSVALVEGSQILATHDEQARNSHSERLMPVIEEIFQKSGKEIQELDLIAVAQGPGSYTGIRIGVTVAKTLAWTLEKTLVGISSLEVLARNLTVPGIIVPLFDARRRTVFSGAYDGMTYERIIPDGHYEADDLFKKLKDHAQNLYFIGLDVDLYWDSLVQAFGPQAKKLEEAAINLPRASVLAMAAMDQEPVQDIHSFVPVYHRIPEAEANWQQGQEND